MQALDVIFQQYCSALEKEGLAVYALSLENTAGEAYQRAWRSSDPCPLYSATKTITSMAVGLALEEGLCKLDDTALQFFPEFESFATEGSEKILLKHLLTMSSGHRSFEYGLNDRKKNKENWAKLFFELSVRDEPGKRFFYSNSDAYLIGRIVQKQSGMSLRDYLLPRLFQPLGIHNPLWGTCSNGFNNGASKLFLEPKEFFKLGHVLLHQGKYKGKTLIPQGYLKEATRLQIESDIIASFKYMLDEEQAQMRQGYGYLAWLGTRSRYRADGKYGQFLAVYPEAGLVLSLMGHEEARPYRFLTMFEALL